MPYLEASRKQKLSDETILPTTAGDLTYLFYRIMLDKEGKCHEGSFINAAERFLKLREETFQRYAEVYGALICAGLEWERRHPFWANEKEDVAKMEVLHKFGLRFYEERVAPYEDWKLELNGDVV